ncbi:MAG: hypothetical protein U0Y68_21120 [Blastocatellia bacterium]
MSGSNAFNLIDGIDGLAAGASALPRFPVLVFSIMMGRESVTTLTPAICWAR